jgi:D-glycerate 3-kinase
MSLWPERVLSESAYQALEAQVSEALRARLGALDISEGRYEDFCRVCLPLAAWVFEQRGGVVTRPLVVGVSGAQGSGKSTLCSLVGLALEQGFGLRVAVLSLDDFYLTRAERETLAAQVHPLLVSRGVPGTHDVALAEKVLDALAGATPASETPLPSFDKARDDRRPEAAWPVFRGVPDVVLFEGWCLGARPQSQAELEKPLNELEAAEDADGRWRRYVNAQLDVLKGEYARLFVRLERLVMLAVPGMAQVLEWRAEQERKLAARERDAASAPAEQRGSGLMDGAQLKRFVMHFERLTLAMLADLPGRAEVTLVLEAQHRFTGVRLRPERQHA